MDKNPILRKNLMEAWERYTNETYTEDDLALILNSFRDDHLQEFEVVANRKWNEVMNKMLSTSEDRKEVYRKKANQLLAEHLNRQKNQKKQIVCGDPFRISSRNNIVRFRKIWYAAAAAILLGLLIPATYLYMKPKTEQSVLVVQYVETDTQRGEIKTVFLPDQTKVTLNSGSRIIYPEHFTGDERSVELHGEALFDVTSDPARPFTIKTENMNIKVVGTVFDVKEYADDLTVSVSVVSGKVEVDLLETGRAASILLEQNQQLKMDKTTGNFEKMTIDADNYMSWIDGTLYFYRTPIREVVNMLNRQYPQVNIEFADGEYSHVISGKHKNVYPLEDILKSIVYSTGLKCSKTGNNKYTAHP